MKTILHNIHRYDLRLSFYMTQLYHHHILNHFMKWISFCGNYGMIWLFVALMTFINPASRSMSIHLLIALIASALIGQISIKSLVQRHRPCHLYPHIPLLVPTPHDSSFPSSHTTSAFACSTIIFLFYPSWGILAYFFAFLTGLSRIYLFVHFLSDVICGMLLGIGIGVFIYYI